MVVVAATITPMINVTLKQILKDSPSLMMVVLDVVEPITLPIDVTPSPTLMVEFLVTVPMNRIRMMNLTASSNEFT